MDNILAHPSMWRRALRCRSREHSLDLARRIALSPCETHSDQDDDHAWVQRRARSDAYSHRRSRQAQWQAALPADRRAVAGEALRRCHGLSWDHGVRAELEAAHRPLSRALVGSADSDRVHRDAGEHRGDSASTGRDARGRAHHPRARAGDHVPRRAPAWSPNGKLADRSRGHAGESAVKWIFNVRRPLLLARNVFIDRESPDLEALARIDDPEAFVWAILPHAARTFSTGIAMLPARSAMPAAVAYLYCRMLDTYEDLVPDRATREAQLTAFGARLARGGKGAPLPAPRIMNANDRDDRDRAHLLLVEKSSLVDQVFMTFDGPTRTVVADLVRDMAEGMRWSSATFASQGGVLVSEARSEERRVGKEGRSRWSP